MKLTKKLLCLGFLLVLVLVPLLTAYGVLTNPTGWSAQENRALAGKPEVSAERRCAERRDLSGGRVWRDGQLMAEIF